MKVVAFLICTIAASLNVVIGLYDVMGAAAINLGTALFCSLIAAYNIVTRND